MKTKKTTGEQRRGRPRGSTGKLKLESHKETIRHYLQLGLSKRKTAKNLRVSYNTLVRFLARYPIALEADAAPGSNEADEKDGENNTIRHLHAT